MRWFRLGAAFAAVVWLCAGCAQAFESRTALRNAYREAVPVVTQESPYTSLPSLGAPYAASVLDERAVDSALGMLNFLRQTAGVSPVSLSRVYMERCGHAAALLAVLDYADHDAPRPLDMEEGFYQIAHAGTLSSNIARLNWMRPSILPEGVQYFVRDDGEANLPALGHRRWALNPLMQSTGFGLANSDSGMTYLAMYAHDLGNADAQWIYVAWPAAGFFPVELMHTQLAWSLTLNPEVYDVSACEPVVTLSLAGSELTFAFDCAAGTGGGYCAYDMQNYGAGPCIVFRPDFSDIAFTDYVQNQVWTVEITGLTYIGGDPAEVVYTVEMTSLYPQEASGIELDRIEAELSVGQTLQLTAHVIPDYADDLTVTWSSDDASVATVSGSGEVIAVGAGTCVIHAENASGRTDACSVTVKP